MVWSDRDRIVLLHEFLLSEPPDGSYDWEEDVLVHTYKLWSADGFEESDGYIDFGYAKAVTSHDHPWLTWDNFKYLPAAGWRYVSSFRSCPNPHLRYPGLCSSIPVEDIQAAMADNMLL